MSVFTGKFSLSSCLWVTDLNMMFDISLVKPQTFLIQLGKRGFSCLSFWTLVLFKCKTWATQGPFAQSVHLQSYQSSHQTLLILIYFQNTSIIETLHRYSEDQRPVIKLPSWECQYLFTINLYLAESVKTVTLITQLKCHLPLIFYKVVTV